MVKSIKSLKPMSKSDLGHYPGATPFDSGKNKNPLVGEIRFGKETVPIIADGSGIAIMYPTSKINQITLSTWIKSPSDAVLKIKKLRELGSLSKDKLDKNFFALGYDDMDVI